MGTANVRVRTAIEVEATTGEDDATRDGGGGLAGGGRAAGEAREDHGAGDRGGVRDVFVRVRGRDIRFGGRLGGERVREDAGGGGRVRERAAVSVLHALRG